MGNNDSPSGGSLDKIMPQSAVEIPSAVGPRITHGQDPAAGQTMVPRGPRTQKMTPRGGSSRGR